MREGSWGASKLYRIHLAPKRARVGVKAIEIVVEADSEPLAIGAAMGWLMATGFDAFTYESISRVKGRA
ncbi:MAG TPA: hypothetical protein VD838_09150 [Anaeromyxobacteraceae bacterium]|nr:hypothetical protein [Anaeromyxobacteraceae bacterium]